MNDDKNKNENKNESKNESNNEKYNEYKEDKYFSNNNNTQLLKKYIHDIKNSTSFSIDNLRNINNLSYEDRMEIFIVYNEMISYYLSIIENN